MKILLVGAGGYAQNYIKVLLQNTSADVVLEGIVDPYYSSCKMKDEIEKLKIPVYDTMDEFYTHHSANLAIICTPTYLHREHSICALSHGSYVLCEKPLATTEKDAEQMLRAEEKYGKWIAIAYQWSFAEAMMSLKRDILAGRFGAPISFKTAISWPRSLDYYNRGTGWAGKIMKDGIIMRDSIASNACAHYLHNMLFLLGGEMDKSAEPEAIFGNCYRANAIESFDTASLVIKAKGIPLFFIASHAAEKNRNAEFVYKFENATVSFSTDDSPNIKAEFCDGRVEYYGNPGEHTFFKMWNCIDAIRNKTKPICTAETAMPHVKLIEMLHRDISIKDFPSELVYYDKEKNSVFVKGLYDRMYSAYDSEELLSF